MGWSPRRSTSPPPLPPAALPTESIASKDQPASGMTPRTQAARTLGQRLGHLLRCNKEIALGILGALGLTVAQVVDGVATLLVWARKQGLYPALAVLAISVAAAGIRQLLAAVWGLSDRLDALAHRWEIQHAELRGEVRVLRSRVDTGPHERIELPSAKTPTDPRWPPIRDA